MSQARGFTTLVHTEYYRRVLSIVVRITRSNPNNLKIVPCSLVLQHAGVWGIPILRVPADYTHDGLC